MEWPSFNEQSWKALAWSFIFCFLHFLVRLFRWIPWPKRCQRGTHSVAYVASKKAPIKLKSPITHNSTLTCCSNTHISLTCHKPLLPLPAFLAPAPQGKGHATCMKKKQNAFKQQKHFAPGLNSCLQIIKQRSKQQESWQSAELLMVGWPSPPRNVNS